MSDPFNPFAQMMQQMQDVARAWPGMDQYDPAQMDKYWPVMPKEMLEHWMASSAIPGGLDLKTRMLLTIAGLTMQGAQAETMFRHTIRQAIELGATEAEISETIGVMAMFAGLPAAQRASRLAQSVTGEGKDK